jgi:threonine/homoserine/homoserine lactone efflux protein
VLVNTLTNPVVVLLVLLFGPVFLHRSQTAYGVFLGAIEVAVVVVEWRLFTWVLGWSNRRALVTSAIANGLSFGVGLLLANGLHWV